MTEQAIGKTEKLEDGTLVAIEGDVDFTRTPELRTALIQLLEDEQPRLVVDLAGVGYMDSSGVATLVEALQIQRKREHKMVLCNLQDKVRSIFEIARLNMVFTIVNDVETATSA